MPRDQRGESTFRPYLVGGGRVEEDGAVRRLVVDSAGTRRYVDAQLDDYTGLSRKRFRWQSPLRLQVRARLSPEIRGTAGFGFWNDPFNPAAWSLPRLPDALWFFYGSPPHDMALVPGVPGHGWKAAVVHAARPGTLAWGLPMLPAMIWAGLTGRTGNAGRIFRRLLEAHEAPVDADMGAWHQYVLDWGLREVRFAVDGLQVLCAPVALRGPLGFVAWIDNQYMVLTPRGQFKWGLLEVTVPQWLEIEIEELAQ